MQKLAAILVLAISTLSLGSSHDRIIGGEDAQDGQFPYVASLRVAGANREFACGGAIVSARTILTAAHCIVGRNPTQLRVVVGTNQIDNSGVEYTVERLVPHPQYSPAQLENDIGLIILTSNITFGDKIRAVELNYTYTAGGLLTTLCGWGNTQLSGGISKDLQWIRLRSITNDECQSVMPIGAWLHAENLCTLNYGEGVGICFGDSGSPVTLDNKLIAVVSWNYPCAINYPDGHMRISFYEQWIKDNVV